MPPQPQLPSVLMMGSASVTALPIGGLEAGRDMLLAGGVPGMVLDLAGAQSVLRMAPGAHLYIQELVS